MDNHPISSKSLEKFYFVDGKQLSQQYRDYLSNYSTWEQKEHSKQWMIFSENIGPFLSIDETSLSNGELYTIVTNKDAKGQKGWINPKSCGIQIKFKSLYNINTIDLCFPITNILIV